MHAFISGIIIAYICWALEGNLILWQVSVPFSQCRSISILSVLAFTHGLAALDHVQWYRHPKRWLCLEDAKVDIKTMGPLGECTWSMSISVAPKLSRLSGEGTARTSNCPSPYSTASRPILQRGQCQHHSWKLLESSDKSCDQRIRLQKLMTTRFLALFAALQLLLSKKSQRH